MTEAYLESDLSAPIADDAMGMSNVVVKSDRLEGRQRQISASIQIPHSAERVWQILTDYEHLADFVPNLAKSHRLPHPQNGVRIEQVGTQNFLRLKFCARVVLDMVEQFPRRLDFQMVEGDFKTFTGSWQLEAIETSLQPQTNLTYSVFVLPPRAMPVAMVEHRLSSSIAVNLAAIQQRANALFGVDSTQPSS